MNTTIHFRSWMSKYVVKIINYPLLCIENPTFSGVFTNFKSFLPTVNKFGLSHTLLHLCFNITSSYEKFHNEINALKQILKLNGYPTHFINRYIKQFLQKLYVTKAIQDTVNKKQLLVVLPFLGAQAFFS